MEGGEAAAEKLEVEEQRTGKEDRGQANTILKQWDRKKRGDMEL